MTIKKQGFGFYGKHAAEILNWYRTFEGYYNKSDIGRMVNYVGVEINGEVYFVYDSWRCRRGTNGFNLAIWAYSLKKAMERRLDIHNDYKEYLGREVRLPEWKDFKTGAVHPAFTTTVAHLRALYELLLGRDITKQEAKYGHQVIDDIVGKPADPFTITQRQMLIDATEKLNSEFESRLDELRAWKHEKMNSLENEFRIKRDDLEKEKETRLKTLEEQYHFLNEAI